MRNPFAITRQEINTKNLSFVGTYIPYQTREYLSTYSLFKGVSKSTIIKQILDELPGSNLEVKKMLTIIATRAIIEWKVRLRESEGKQEYPDFDKYLNFLNTMLKKRGICLEHIKIILNKVKEHGANKESSENQFKRSNEAKSLKSL